MRKRLAALLLIMASMIVAFVPAIEGYPGGVATGTEQYDCGGSCHTNPSSATVTMWSPNITVESGGSFFLTVNVTGGQAFGSPLGVMITRSLTTTSSLPSDDGWIVVKDPGGVTSYNYYEVSSYGGSVSLVWEMTAPTVPGAYVLYARTMHGGGEAYAVDFIAGLTVEVGTAPIPEFNLPIVSVVLVTVIIVAGAKARNR